jgi:agmatinase
MPTIIKIPFDKCIVEKERRGAALAPDAIQRESENIFLSEDGKDWRKNARWIDVPVSDEFEKTAENIKKAYSENSKDIVVSLGGDNSISYSLMEAFAKAHKGKKIGVLYFDAHFDMQDNFIPPTHEDVLSGAIGKIFCAHEVLVVGVRNYTKEELKFVETWSVPNIKAKEFNSDKKKSIANILKFCSNLDVIYFMLDIDAIDPRFAPGTGWPEPLGLFPDDVLSIILKLKDKIKLLDIVEVCPPRDINNITSRLAAKILVEFLA